MSYHWYDFIGNIGIVCILSAYLALHTDRINPKGWRYSALNGAGALLILLSLCFAFNLSAFLIELAWLIISGYGLLKFYNNKRRAS